MAEFDIGDGKFWYQCMINTAFDSQISPAMLEKFSRVKSGAPQLKFHIKTLRLLDASLEVISERVKNNEKAQEYRNNGNYLFSSDGDNSTAAEMYTKSIAYALPGSRELALAYANRSAVSFKAKNYEDCLVDIERSLENDYPEEMRAKLYARRVRCLVALKKPEAEIEEALEDTKDALLKMDQEASGRDLVEKTLNDKNHLAPPKSIKKGIKRLEPTIQDDSCDIRGATGISIQYSEKYGRHLVATRDIRPGEIIAVIETYANARTPDKCHRECSQCTKKTTVGIPCYHCVNVIYCSIPCRDKAWKEYHEIECPILGILLDLEITTTALLGMKITLKALQEAGGVVELKEMLKQIDSISDPRVKGFTGNALDCTKYACVYTLTSHAGKHINKSYIVSMMSTFTIYYLATKTEVFGQKYQTDLKVFDKNPLLGFLGGLMIKNCEIVQMTGCGIHGGNDVQIAPFTALCNHSCDSNVTYFGTQKSIVFALQPIKTGEQIWDTYQRLHYSSKPKGERQKMLKDHYFFTCDCVACTKNWPVLEKLPSAFEMPGLPPTIRTRLSQLEMAFLIKYNLSLENGDMFAAKDDLIQLVELLFLHANPSEEMITYRQWLMAVNLAGLDPS